MTKKQEQLNRDSEIEKIVQDALKDSYHYENMKCYGTHYFWVKTADRFSAIFVKDFNTFVEIIRVTSTQYRNWLMRSDFKTYQNEIEINDNNSEAV